MLPDLFIFQLTHNETYISRDLLVISNISTKAPPQVQPSSKMHLVSVLLMSCYLPVRSRQRRNFHFCFLQTDLCELKVRFTELFVTIHIKHELNSISLRHGEKYIWQELFLTTYTETSLCTLYRLFTFFLILLFFFFLTIFIFFPEKSSKGSKGYTKAVHIMTYRQ